jgi:hypothetical protein
VKKTTWSTVEGIKFNNSERVVSGIINTLKEFEQY